MKQLSDTYDRPGLPALQEWTSVGVGGVGGDGAGKSAAHVGAPCQDAAGWEAQGVEVHSTYPATS